VFKRDDLISHFVAVRGLIRFSLPETHSFVQGMEGMGGMEMFKRDEMMAKMGMGGDDDDDDDDEDEFTSVSNYAFFCIDFLIFDALAKRIGRDVSSCGGGLRGIRSIRACDHQLNSFRLGRLHFYEFHLFPVESMSSLAV
jgi:hypothetical protein